MKGSAQALPSYLRGIQKQLKDGFPDEEHKTLFLTNVFEEVGKDFSTLAAHATTSFILQDLIKLASASQLEELLRSLLKSLELLIAECSATYVIEDLLCKATHFFDSDKDNVIMKLIYQIGMKLLERVDLMTSKVGSFAVRTLIEVMSGVNSPHSHGKKQRLVEMKEHDFYGEFASLLQTFSGYLLPTTPSTFELIDWEPTSALAQVLLNVFHKRDQVRCSQVCHSIIANGFFDRTDSDGLPAPLTNKSGSYFCSNLVQSMDSNSIGQLITKVISPKFDSLVADSHANYVIQDVIKNLGTEKQLKVMCKLMKGKMFRLMSENRGGVVLQLLTAALKYSSMQKDLLMKWKGETGDSEVNFLIDLAVGSPSHDLQDKEICQYLRRMSFLNSRILQTLFSFEDPTYICECMKILSIEQKVNLACSKTGSYTIEAMLNAERVHIEYKLAFISSLKNHYTAMITDVYGSRVFDEFWRRMNVSSKREVTVELAKNIAPIMGTPCGKQVVRNIHLQDYMHRRPTWEKWLVEDNKTHRLLVKTTKKKNRSLSKGSVKPELKEKVTTESAPEKILNLNKTEQVKSVKKSKKMKATLAPSKVTGVDDVMQKPAKKKAAADVVAVVRTPEPVKKRNSVVEVSANATTPPAKPVVKKRKSTGEGMNNPKTSLTSSAVKKKKKQSVNN